MSNNLTNVQNCWIPTKTFAQQVQWPSASALRSYAFKAKELGLEPAFLRVRRRLLINPAIFFEKIAGVPKGDLSPERKNPTSKTLS